MATATALYDFNVSTNANFQALMGAIEANLIAFGWTLTGDTGQTDPASAAAPSSSTYAGYRVYQTNDAHTVYYVKIQFGRGSGNGPRLAIDLGTTTNGAGTMTGNTMTQIVLTSALTSGSRSLHMAGNTGRMMIAWAHNSSTTSDQCAIAIGRMLDTAGATTSTAIEMFAGLGGNSMKAQLIPFSGTVGVQESAWPCAFTARSPAVHGTAVLIGVPVLSSQSLVCGPTLLCAIYDGVSFTNNTSTVATVYGASHTYLVGNMANVWATSGNPRTLMFYE